MEVCRVLSEVVCESRSEYEHKPVGFPVVLDFHSQKACLDNLVNDVVAKDNDIFIGSVHISDSDTRIYQAESPAEKALGSVYSYACWAPNPVAPSD